MRERADCACTKERKKEREKKLPVLCKEKTAAGMMWAKEKQKL